MSILSNVIARIMMNVEVFVTGIVAVDNVLKIQHVVGAYCQHLS